MKNILFICKYNRFRSKTAEAIFNKINKDKTISVKRAGLKFNGKPTGLTTKLLKWQDTMIIVADDIPKSLFKENIKYGKKLIVWNIPDSKTDTKEEIRKITKQIEKKVKELIK